MSTAPELLPIQVENGRVAEDLACADCDYNLRTIPIDGRCPECGLSIDDTRAFLGDVAGRKANGRDQIVLLRKITFFLWIACGTMIGIIFVAPVAGEDLSYMLQRVVGVVVFLALASSGTILLIAAIMSLSAALHRDYANARGFLYTAAFNPILILALVVMTLRC